MAATGDGVRLITGTTLDDIALAPFLLSADCVIADAVAAGCTGKTQACLDLASNFLASHFLTTSKVGEGAATLTSEKFENYSKTLKNGANDGTGIMSTSYGQTANTLMSGCLEGLDNSPAVVEFA